MDFLKKLTKLCIPFGSLHHSQDPISHSETRTQEESVVLELTRDGMIIFGLIDAEDSSVDVSNYLRKSGDFHNLTEYHQKLLKQFPDNEGIPPGRLLKAGYLITLSQKRIASFEKNVRRLIMFSSMVSFDTPFLQEVKQHIDTASFSKAYEVLNNYDLFTEQKNLLQAKTQNNVSPVELDERLRTNATGFFLKALLVDLDTSEEIHLKTSQWWFSELARTQEILSYSVKSYAFPENTFEYCIISQKNGIDKRIESYYQQIIHSEIPGSNAYVPLALHNLGVLYRENRNLEMAEAQLKEALTFFRIETKRNPGVFIPHIAITLSNLATVYVEKKDFLRAKKMFHDSVNQFCELVKTNPGKFLPGYARTLKKYADTCREYNDLSAATRWYREAITRYRVLVKTDMERFQPLLLDTLNKSIELSFVTENKNEGSDSISEALALCRNLVRKNPGKYLPDLAKILIQSAMFHLEKDIPDLAEMELKEAISICRRFRKLNDSGFLYTPHLAKALTCIGVLYMNTNRPDLANRELSRSIAQYHQLTYNPGEIFELAKTLNILSILFQRYIPDRDRSIHLACEAIYVIRPWIHIRDSIRAIYLDSLEILHYWGFSENLCDNIVQDTKIVNILKTEKPYLDK